MKYTIGLDIGTNSVGWAVIRDRQQLVRRKMNVDIEGNIKKVKKNFWGVRLFEEGQTAENTRLKRTTRRRLQRRKNRISYLQEIFAPEMNRVDENFFVRLRDSFLTSEDKNTSRHPIFGTLEEEAEFHLKYPTIYHLRKDLADSTEKKDLRLVYLSMAHIIKFRGHFLIEGKLDSKNISIDEAFFRLIDSYNANFASQGDGSYINLLKKPDTVESILKAKYSPSKKVEEILKLFPDEKKNGSFAVFLKLMVGNLADFKKVFDLDTEMKLQIPKEEFEEELETLLGLVGDEYADTFQYATETYNAMKLSTILRDSDPATNGKLSDSMVKRYQQHKIDLANLKKIFRAQLPDKYDSYFKDAKKNGYAGYIDGETKQIDFYKETKKLLNGVEGSEPFIEKIDQEDFLRKQRTFDNGVIPHQIHQEELEAILQAQGQFYPFLRDNAEKILSIFSFRIPYYVGPLTTNKVESRFAWMTKKGDEEIRPWNFEKLVDKEQSAIDFIERMTNFDTYLPDEKVLPKHSMLYELYAVLNELTKVSYTDDQGKSQRFCKVEKQKIINELFKKNRKVSRKKLEEFLHNEYNIENPSVSGIEDNFLAKLATYHDFIKVGISPELLDSEDSQDMFEEIIKILTVFEDKKMIRRQLKPYSFEIGDSAVKKLERRHYTGWGRLSKELLTGIRDKDTSKTILDYLWDDDDTPKNRNRNFMQLINDNDLSFKRIIEDRQTEMDSDNLKDLVHGLAGSPAIKKGILQSIMIVDEIVKIMGNRPEKIVVEMARENQKSRKVKTRLKLLEEKLNEFKSNLLSEEPTDNGKLKRDALFLYYLQNGKDMYTGNELDINNLSNYDIDHIIPQAFIDDDSLDNRVLVSSSSNRGKSDNVPSIETVNRMEFYWERLLKAELISKRKFDNLTKAKRGGLTDEDKAGFIARQLVETRQITKNVARILHERYNHPQITENEKVDIVTLKSSIVSQFRKQFGIYKVREVNDYHHAHDAYLNAVVSEIILKVYPKLKPEFVYGDYAKVNMIKINKATAKKELYSNIMKFFSSKEVIFNEDGEVIWSNNWVGGIKKVLSSKQMNIVKKVEVQKGKFSKEGIQPKGKNDNLIPRKDNWDVNKYGGFQSPVSAYGVLISSEKGKKRNRKKEIIGISVMERFSFEAEPISFLQQRGYINPSVEAIFPKYSLFEFNNGRRRIMASYKETQKGNQMVLPDYLVELLYHAKRVDKDDTSKEYFQKHREQLPQILDIVIPFAEKYTLAANKAEQICTLFEKYEGNDIELLANSFIELMKFNEMKSYSPFNFLGTKITETRYRSTSELINSWIIHQSVTGLYESRKWLGD
ncbi:type II CRISPR RNA-guided endonuclease Cas9 [Enterococcus asini]|uniref:type II CRISPR RNA-guided endonuclease Cas9 n=1 Tax=Enterococcus asini TaxID=57732 RepID=UPI00288F952B|nr:type II CRISPR RNA-guided endonuclease Cas9 [Enterococcus asini]MDT2756009.1 type II CRISPR RNA-guided endonuclease Cas9 [Enterococcus asini]